MRTTFSLIMTLILLLSSLSCVSAKNQTDIENHWAENTLQRWIDSNWIPNVNDDGKIRPNDSVTRAEFATFVNHAFQYTSTAASLPYTDLPDDHWAYQQISIAYKAGYMKGDSSNMVSPNSPATRQEVALMLNQILNLEDPQTLDLSIFLDSSDISTWARFAVSSLSETQILKGYPDGNFRPLATMTRAEAIVAIDTALNYSPNNDIPPSTIDHLSRLKVSDNGRFLTQADSTPFFWLGDTAWELAHRLDRNEVALYLQSAADNGFNVIQFVALAELSGLTEPNSYGDLPLIDKNPTIPAITAGNDPKISLEYDYWDHIDYIIDTADSLGIYVALLPSWASYLWENKGEEADPIFNVTNASAYGKWLGERYGEKDNIIWVLGGDRIPDSKEKLTIIRNMANGLDSGGGTQIKTYHPWGGRSSSEYFHNDDWLDFNSHQSGHRAKDYANYNLTKTDYEKDTIKPTFDIEPRYEHLPVKFNLDNGRFEAYDARQAAYWSLFAGAFGHTYGHNSIWQMYDVNRNPIMKASTPWTKAIHAEGRTTMKWIKVLLESRPMLARVPDQSLISDDLSGANKIMATRGDDYAFIYSTTGESFNVNMGKISGDTVSASWYNPRTGAFTVIGDYKNTGNRIFNPPSKGRGNDWVLVLDDKSKNY
ncbi:MAG: hypothetical protein CVU84_15130 [Firmicutes bacterium HGW-Firmicutes-1]|nr:MAG: hypothetical protein CVU84_15130 [Firmicutes bacterium HGW-Firmicutes-1]